MTDRSQRPVWLGEDKRGWDHVRVHVQLLRDTRLDAYHLAVYLGIAAHAELSSGKAFPSASTLARYAGISDRKVRDVLRDLATWKYLRIERTAGQASTFTLLPPPPLQEVQPSEEPPAGAPLNDMPDTPAPDADEQEPSTRSMNDEQPPNPPQAGGEHRGQHANCRACGTNPRGPRPPEPPVPPHPANRNEARRANPCKQCDGDQHVEALGGTMVQCPRCSGSGVEPSRRVS